MIATYLWMAAALIFGFIMGHYSAWSDARRKIKALELGIAVALGLNVTEMMHKHHAEPKHKGRPAKKGKK